MDPRHHHDLNPLEVTEMVLAFARLPKPKNSGLVMNKPLGGMSHAGRLFQARMWRDYAMQWDLPVGTLRRRWNRYSGRLAPSVCDVRGSTSIWRPDYVAHFTEYQPETTMSFLLTDEERSRFVAYLDNVAASNEAVARQMVEIAVPEVLISRQRNEAAACRVVAEMLRSAQIMTVGQR